MQPSPDGIYQNLLAAKASGSKMLAVLLDPDKLTHQKLRNTLELAEESAVDCFLLGGSLIVNYSFDSLIDQIHQLCDIPVILFPGNVFQVSAKADALLLLSLISGRNPELLIGQHVIAAPMLKSAALEVISTGYILVDGNVQSTVQYMSNTIPIPAQKTDIAVCTALAGTMLGLKTIYLEAGSGAQTPVPLEMVKAVRAAVDTPLFVGGGIRTPELVYRNFQAGADVVVVGTAFEQNPTLIREMVTARAHFH